MTKRSNTSEWLRGSAAAQCGEALPHRRDQLIEEEAAPPRVEAHRGPKGLRLLTAHRSLLTFFLLFTPSLTVGLLTRAFSQTETPPSLSQASPTPTPLPSPSPTPPPNLHQWGAVTLFHGLPSDRVHAIVQTPDGLMWFATDGGLAKYDGRRTQAISAEGLESGRVLALKVDDDGALWIGGESGAVRFDNGKFEPIKETNGSVITAIISPQKGRAMMASENGVIFDCQLKREPSSSSAVIEAEKSPVVTFAVTTIPSQPLQSADKDHPGLLKLTSLAFLHDTLYAGTQSRGLISIENGEAREVISKPRSYFINALDTDIRGRLWVGARGRADESVLFDQSDPLKPIKTNSSTGPVTAIARGAGEDIWVATDGHGAFHFQNGKPIEHFTFEGTGGALRSDHVLAIFIDREEVVWFGTDKGVCRYDPHAMRAENISADTSANYVRALFRTPRGSLLAGTNSGLFVQRETAKGWQSLPDVGRRIVYAINEDKSNRILIGTAAGLFVSAGEIAFVRIKPPEERLPQGDSVRAIANLNGVTYIATYGYGVEKLEGSRRALVWPDEAADVHLREVTSLGSDASNRLVIGTAGAGIFFLDGRQTTSDSSLDKLKGQAIWSIVADGSGIWLGAEKGLYLFQSGQLKEIVPGVNARSVAIGSNDNQSKQVWCATVGNGLLRVTVDERFGPAISRMDVEQGLPSQRVFAVLPERGSDDSESMLIGTNRGVARYEPGRIAPTLYATRIISKRVHQPSELARGLDLDYPQNSLLFEVTATSSRTFPEQFLYAFALYDAAGHAIKQKLSHDSQFPMEGLRPGKYRVVARAFTKDLVGSNPLSFEMSVARAPFPWTTTALAILLLLALIALGWGYVQNRRIHRAGAELAAANSELADARLQLANETEAERRRIARDLHDQTLADLRNLALLVDRLPPSGDTRLPLNRAPSAPSALRHEIESISHEVRRICEDLSPSALENVGLSAALQFALSHAVEHAAPACKFDYEFVCEDSLDEKVNLPQSTQIQIYRIAQEALSNICRHANAGHVKMSASVNDNSRFELLIEDDGRGFDLREAKKNSGRGVANIRARASMIDAEVGWHQSAGGGTLFSLRLA